LQAWAGTAAAATDAAAAAAAAAAASVAFYLQIPDVGAGRTGSAADVNAYRTGRRRGQLERVAAAAAAAHRGTCLTRHDEGRRDAAESVGSAERVFAVIMLCSLLLATAATLHRYLCSRRRNVA